MKGGDRVLDQSELSECDPDAISIKEKDPKKADRVSKLPDRLAAKSDANTIGNGPKDEGILDASVYYQESGELFAENNNHHMAVLPEIVTSTAEVSIDDIQVGDPGVPLTDDQEKLRLLIYKNRHLLIGKGSALPPAARGTVRDVEV